MTVELFIPKVKVDEEPCQSHKDCHYVCSTEEVQANDDENCIDENNLKNIIKPVIYDCGNEQPWREPV